MTEKQQLNIEELFVDGGEASTTRAGNSLSKTAQLTNLAEGIAREVFNKASADAEEYGAKIQASMESHDAMDALINECYNIDAVDIGFLKTEQEEELMKMIRSQQSKRSRAKSKVMTQENYLTMMTGAVAEILLRIAANKPKNSGGAVAGELGYSDEELAELAKNPEELKKAIRNVQSKKSIMRSKNDFDEESPRYLQLLSIEEQLKAIRDEGKSMMSQKAKQALEERARLQELMEGTDFDELPPEQAMEMLEQIKETLASN